MTTQEKLKVEYATLSEVLEGFPKKSSHSVATAINTRMQQILELLEAAPDAASDEPTVVKLLNPIPRIMFNDQHMPTQEALDYLKNWWAGHLDEDDKYCEGEFCRMSKENIATLIHYVNKLWRFNKWGFFHDPYNNRLELHTGGSPGNEEVMKYFAQTAFAKVHWKMSKSGGHYYYEWK